MFSVFMVGKHPKANIASLGTAEAEILRLVWDLKEASAQQIWEALPEGRDVAPATVLTVLRRLRDKGFLKSRTLGKAHFFSPAIQPQQVISKKVGELLKRFFGDDPVPLVMHLAETHQIDQDDVARLQEMLAAKKKKKEL
jgi:predicted transcriptional regulator